MANGKNENKIEMGELVNKLGDEFDELIQKLTSGKPTDWFDPEVSETIIMLRIPHYAKRAIQEHSESINMNQAEFETKLFSYLLTHGLISLIGRREMSSILGKLKDTLNIEGVAKSLTEKLGGNVDVKIIDLENPSGSILGIGDLVEKFGRKLPHDLAKRVIGRLLDEAKTQEDGERIRDLMQKILQCHTCGKRDECEVLQEFEEMISSLEGKSTLH